MAKQAPLESGIATRLKAARRKAGINQRRLCKISGVSSSYVSMLELGQRTNPETGKLGQIADALGVTLDWLALGRGPTPSAKRIRAAVEAAAAKLAPEPASTPEAAQ